MVEGLTVYADPATMWPTQLRGPLERAVEDCRWFAHLARQAKLDQLWRQLAPTWGEFCEQKLGHPAEFVDAVIAGVRAIGEDAPVPIERAAAEGRRIRQAESKRLVEVEQMSLRQAAEVLGCAPSTVLEDTRREVFDESLSNEKSNTRTPAQRVDSRQVYLPTDPARAAQKIREKLGDEFAARLKESL